MSLDRLVKNVERERRRVPAQALPKPEEEGNSDREGALLKELDIRKEEIRLYRDIIEKSRNREENQRMKI